MSFRQRIVSAGIALALASIGFADAGAFSVRSIDLKVKDLLYNPHDGLLYVTVPGIVPERGNTVTLIDPATGAFAGAIPVGSEPSTLALSDDGGTLYVGLDGASVIKRVNTATRAVELEIPLPPDPTFGAMVAGEMSVMPGQPHTVAVALKYSGNFSPTHAGVAVYDDAVQRPTRTPGHTGSNAITFGTRTDHLYGTNLETSEYGFRKMLIDAAGVTVLSVTTDIILGWREFEWFDGRIYSNGGRVVEPETAAILGTFPLSFDDYDRTIAPDKNFVYFLSNHSYTGVVLTRFDPKTFALVDRRQVRGAFDPPTGAVRWGAHGLAYYTFDFFSEFGKVYLLDGIDDPPNANLELTVRESRDPTIVGGYVTYLVMLKNLGPDDAADVQLVSNFGGGYALQYAQSPRGSCAPSGDNQVCQLGTIAAGDSALTTFLFQVDHEGQLTYHGVASSSIGDVDPSNNEVTETTTIVPRPPETDLDVTAEFDASVGTIGTPVSLVIDVRNRGKAPAPDARLDARLGGTPFRIDSYDNPNGACSPNDSTHESTCTLGTIAPGGEARVRIQITPLADGYLSAFLHVTSGGVESTPYDNFFSIYLPVQSSPESRIDSLTAHVTRLRLKPGTEKSLLRPLEDARAAVGADNLPGMCSSLLEFGDALTKKVRDLSIPIAYSLLAEATTIRDLMGCNGPLARDRHFTPKAETHAEAASPEDAIPHAPSFRVASNPTSSGSRLWFDLGKAGRAKLQVYDARGRLVQVLADQLFTSGPHEISWSPKAAGVYFYRFEPEGGMPILSREVVLR